VVFHRLLNQRNTSIALVLLTGVVGFLYALSASHVALGQVVNIREIPFKITDPGTLESVHVYKDGTARISRKITIKPGYIPSRFQISHLPQAIVPASIGVSGPDSVVISNIEFERVPDESDYENRLRTLTNRHDELTEQIEDLTGQQQVLDREQALYEAVAQSIAERAGQGSVDLDEVTKTAEYITEKHTDIESRRHEIEVKMKPIRADLERVSSALSELRHAGPNSIPSIMLLLDSVESIVEPFELTLSYLVMDVAWAPVYTIRAEPDQSRVIVEMDAFVHQQSGEDWSDVELILSTGTPTLRTSAPQLQSVSVGVAAKSSTRSNARRILDELNQSESASAESPSTIDDLMRRFSQSETTDSPDSQTTENQSRRSTSRGVLAEYSVMTRATVPDHLDYPIRLRLAQWHIQSDFEYVAAPLVSPNAYLRASFTNNSSTPWPASSASVYHGGESVGRTWIADTHPNDPLNIYFGTNKRILVQRRVVSKNTKTTGLLAEGRRTITEYEISIANTTGRSIKMELWDRIPYSSHAKIKVDVSHLNHPICEGPVYLKLDRPLGYLRWNLTVPPGVATDEQHLVKYRLSVSHHKDVTPTSWPD